jgi:hypothetical protein
MRALQSSLSVYDPFKPLKKLSLPSPDSKTSNLRLPRTYKFRTVHVQASVANPHTGRPYLPIFFEESIFHLGTADNDTRTEIGTNQIMTSRRVRFSSLKKTIRGVSRSSFKPDSLVDPMESSMTSSQKALPSESFCRKSKLGKSRI